MNAKTAEISGTLDRYTEGLVQVSGYEELSYSGELPVYVLQGDAFAGEKKLTDLIIGTSQIRLVVAEGRACAVIQSREESFENIRVLIKNKSALFYKNIYVTSGKKYIANGKKKKGNQVTNIKKVMKDCREGRKSASLRETICFILPTRTAHRSRRATRGISCAQGRRGLCAH